jgi:uncharacterized protein (TIGR02757 family)
MPLKRSRHTLDTLYDRYTRREFVHPDPVEFLYAYPDVRDREIVGLVASALAYGRVSQILASVARVVETMGPSPHAFLATASRDALRQTFDGFQHRFTTGDEIGSMLCGVQQVRAHYGSLEAAFVAGMNHSDETVVPALAAFVEKLATAGNGRPHFLLPSPQNGSACKRLNLFLRWMVRRDPVDPGGWDSIPAAMLVVPVDTHMHKIARTLGLTKRKAADLRAALEITTAFRAVAPTDPVRYDFALTRLGIRPDTDLNDFLNRCHRAVEN